MNTTDEEKDYIHLEDTGEAINLAAVLPPDRLEDFLFVLLEGFRSNDPENLGASLCLALHRMYGPDVGLEVAKIIAAAGKDPAATDAADQLIIHSIN